MKNKICNAVLAILLVLIIAITGIGVVNELKNGDKWLQMYENTTFDLFLTGPTKDYIENANEKYEKVSPVYISKTEVGERTMQYILFENEEDRQNTFFNDKMLIEGNYDGVVLDELMAEGLSKGVGDKVQVQLRGTTMEAEVTGIVRKIVYPLFDDGTACLQLPEKYLYLYNKTDYNDVFIQLKADQKVGKTNDEIIASIKKEFEGYVPEAGMNTKEEFISDYRSKHEKPNDMSEAEWYGRLESSYESYRLDFIEADHSDSVQIKLDVSKRYVEQGMDARGNAKTIIVSVTIGIVLLIFIVQAIGYFLGSREDRRRRNDENRSEKVILIHVLATYVVMTIVALLGAFAVIKLIGNGVLQSTLNMMLIPYGLAILLTMIAVTVIYILLWKKTYASSIASKKHSSNDRSTDKANKQKKEKKAKEENRQRDGQEPSENREQVEPQPIPQPATTTAMPFDHMVNKCGLYFYFAHKSVYWNEWYRYLRQGGLQVLKACEQADLRCNQEVDEYMQVAVEMQEKVNKGDLTSLYWCNKSPSWNYILLAVLAQGSGQDEACQKADGIDKKPENWKVEFVNAYKQSGNINMALKNAEEKYPSK